MFAYVVRRLFATIVVMAVVAFVVFLLLYLTPGDPAAILAGDAATSDDISRIREKLGLDEPFLSRFGNWVWRLLHGDLGVSIFTNLPVTQLIGQRIEPTLSLTLCTLVIAVLVAVPGSRSYFDVGSVAADSTAQRVLQPLLFIPLGTVVFEEVIFRGVLLGVALRVWSRTPALVVTSLCFGLWHLPPALRDASDKGAAAAVGVVAGTIAVTTVAGAAFGWLRLRSGSLLAPMMAHVATNSFAYAAAVATV